MKKALESTMLIEILGGFGRRYNINWFPTLLVANCDNF